MKVLFDTSVLVAAFFRDLPSHGSSLAALDMSASPVCAVHSLAEFYAASTRMPIQPRALPSDVLHFLRDLRARVELVNLTADEYVAAIDDFAAAGRIGRLIYDFLIARCALKCAADVICTWNLRHFQQFERKIVPTVKTPVEFLGQ